MNSVELPVYKCHKEVWALKIKSIVIDGAGENRESDGSAIITPEESDYAPFKVDANYMQKHKPHVGGYYVVYEDGYVSFSPAAAFEKGYSLKRTNQLSFGEAIEEAKKGYKIARKGWNGKGMYAIIMPGYPNGIPINETTAKAHNVSEGTVFKFRPYFQLKTAQNDIAMWSPSGSDSLAEDWEIVF